MSVKKKLILVFSTVVGSLLLFSFVIWSAGIYIRSQYHLFIDNIVDEYRIIQINSQIVSAYNSQLQDVSHLTNLANFPEKKSMDDLFTILDSRITLPASKNIYERLKNTYALEIENIAKGLTNAKAGDFTQSVDILDQINRTNTAVTEDAEHLISAELNSAIVDWNRLQSQERNLFFGGLFSLLIIGGFFSWLIVTLSTRAITPIIKLSELSAKVTQGNFDQKVDQALLSRHDEIGVLSQSFDAMVQKIRKMISELTESKKELEQSTEKLTKKALEAQKINKLMVGRELKMIELKKEISRLKQS